MKKPIIYMCLGLLLFLGACVSEPIIEQSDEITADVTTQGIEENYSEETDKNDIGEPLTTYIPIKIPFAPLAGNVVRISHTYFATLIFTDDAIWKIENVWEFSEELSAYVRQFLKPARMMDTIDNIERVIENTHLLTTDNTLYFLDFTGGEAVKQLENVVSTYHFHVGTVLNPLRYVRTADGASWRVDEALPIRLSDDYIVRCGRPLGCDGTILDIVSADLWFDSVRDAWSLHVLAEDNILWVFDSFAYDAVPTKIMADVQTLQRSFFITIDNVLWLLPPWYNKEASLNKVMENVRLVNNGLIITTDNELWGYRPWRDDEPFKIMENVQSVQYPFGFITLDNTLWWLPDWGRSGEEYQEPIRIKENVLRTWWNWSESEYIKTTDGSLWLFNYQDNYLVQVFQAK